MAVVVSHLAVLSQLLNSSSRAETTFDTADQLLLMQGRLGARPSQQHLQGRPANASKTKTISKLFWIFLHFLLFLERKLALNVLMHIIVTYRLLDE